VSAAPIGVRPLFVSAAVLEQLYLQAAAAAVGMEVGGWLVVRPGEVDHVEEYLPVENAETEPGWFSPSGFPDLPPGWGAIVCHSHPTGQATPSVGDLAEALACYGGLVGVFVPGQLRVWRVLARQVVGEATVDADPADYCALPVILGGPLRRRMRLRRR
jgi:proteasome lid subunit RPN8/RPN11